MAKRLFVRTWFKAAVNSGALLNSVQAELEHLSPRLERESARIE